MELVLHWPVEPWWLMICYGISGPCLGVHNSATSILNGTMYSVIIDFQHSNLGYQSVVRSCRSLNSSVVDPGVRCHHHQARVGIGLRSLTPLKTELNPPRKGSLRWCFCWNWCFVCFYTGFQGCYNRHGQSWSYDVICQDKKHQSSNTDCAISFSSFFGNGWIFGSHKWPG